MSFLLYVNIVMSHFDDRSLPLWNPYNHLYGDVSTLLSTSQVHINYRVKNGVSSNDGDEINPLTTNSVGGGFRHS